MKKLAIALFSIFILVGCSTNTTTCTYESAGMKFTEKITSKDNVVTHQITTAILEMDTSTVDPEELILLEGQLAQTGDSIEGVTTTFDTTPTSITFSYKIDFLKADLNELMEKGFVANGTVDNVLLEDLISQFDMNSTNSCKTK